MIVCSIYNSILQADLASIHSEEENDFLREITGNTHKVWLGGRRCCPGCQAFEWSDGTPWDFTDWYRGEPNNHVKMIDFDLKMLIIIQRVGMRTVWKNLEINMKDGMTLHVISQIGDGLCARKQQIEVI